MISLGNRRLNKIGGSFMISLPMVWIEGFDGKIESVDVQLQPNGKLLITPKFENNTNIKTVDVKCCWNCSEDDEIGTIGNDGLCDYCRDLYEKDDTAFERCLVCNGLIEHGNKNATKDGDQCICKVITCNSN